MAVVWLVVSGGVMVLAKMYLQKPETTPAPPGERIIAKFAVTFKRGTADMMAYSQADLERRIVELELSTNPERRVKIIGHISPGSSPLQEEDLTRRQIETVRGFMLPRGVRDSCITREPTKDPDENGTYGGVTVVVTEKAQ
ncbi:MAG: hypothetical protein A2Y77_10060 [Planctomycetes bacterium RBG_13_62_9]|nr:MAG: hypothetical protein A2Y77_10060 [Planctomycetes bacterium RBG_13_62_9]